MTRSRAVGGVLVAMAVVGAVVLPSSGTLALLSDRVSVDASAGAASLALTARPAAVDGARPEDMALDPTGSGDVEVGTSGDLPWALQVQVIDAEGEPDCDVADVLALGTALGGAGDAPPGECSWVLARTGTGTVAGAISVRRTGEMSGGPWAGFLRVTLRQQPGGFSDQVDVPLRLLDPGTTDPAEPLPAGLPAGGDVPVEPPATGRSGAVDPSPGSTPGTGSAVPASAPAPSATEGPSTSTRSSEAPPAAAVEPSLPEAADADVDPSDVPGEDDGGPAGHEDTPTDSAPDSEG